MPTDQQISIMCDIAASSGAGFAKSRARDLIELVAAGYIERDRGLTNLYKLTAKGRRVLDERGVGANDA